MQAIMLCCRDDGWQRRGRLAVYGISKRASPPTDISALRRFVDPMDLNRYSIRVPVVSHGRTAANQLPSNDIQGPDSLQLCPTQTLCAWSNGVSPPSQLHFTGLIPNELARSSHRGPRRDRKRQLQERVLFVRCMHKASPIHTTLSHTIAKSAKSIASSQGLPAIQVDRLHPPASF